MEIGLVFFISSIVQLAALVCGVYWMFTESFLGGLGLIALIALLHFAISGLSNGLLYLHQKTMSESEQELFAHFSRIGRANETAPRAWHLISTGCAVLFWVASGAVIIWYFQPHLLF